MLFHVMLESNNWVGLRERPAGKAAIAEVLWKHSPVCPSILLARGKSHPLQLLFNSVRRENMNHTGKSPLRIKAWCEAKKCLCDFLKVKGIKQK